MRLFTLAALVVLAAPLASAQNTGLDATYRTMTLREGFTPDPWSLQLTAGGATPVSISGCNGTVANAPDVEMTYQTSGSSNLYIYATSGSDTTILVNGANGQWYCNDDGLGNRNPVVVIPNAAGGTYDIWVGTFGSDTAPATLYISEIDPRGGGVTPTPAPSSGPNPGLDATYRTMTLREGFTPDPWSLQLTAGGATPVTISGCNGTVASAPDVEMTYQTSGSSNLYIYATSGSDTTILVNGANGQWYCNDDGLGNRNPVVVIPNAAGGTYDIWVGTFGSDTAPATLHISEIDPR